MKQEIFELIVKARENITTLEDYLFTNDRASYITAKGILDTAIEHIDEIEENIENADDELLAAAKTDLEKITTATANALAAYNAPVVQNEEIMAIEEVTPVTLEETEGTPVEEITELVEEPTTEEIAPVMLEEVPTEEVFVEETIVEEPVEETFTEEVVEETVVEAPVEEVMEVAPEVVEEVAEITEEATEVAEEVTEVDDVVETAEETTDVLTNDNIEFSEEELNNLLAALDSANFEAIFADEEMPTEIFEPSVEEVPVSPVEPAEIVEAAEVTEEVAEEAPVEEVVETEEVAEEAVVEPTEEVVEETAEEVAEPTFEDEIPEVFAEEITAETFEDVATDEVVETTEVTEEVTEVEETTEEVEEVAPVVTEEVIYETDAVVPTEVTLEQSEEDDIRALETFLNENVNISDDDDAFRI